MEQPFYFINIGSKMNELGKGIKGTSCVITALGSKMVALITATAGNVLTCFPSSVFPGKEMQINDLFSTGSIFVQTSNVLW